MFDAVGAIVRGVAQAATVFLAAVGIFILMAVFGLLSAFVVHDYWNWFVSPLGMPRIGIFHAYGLIILVNLLRGFASNEQQNDSDSIASIISKPLVGLALTWGLGWLIVTIAGPF